MSGALITTRAASETNLGEEMAGQLLSQPRTLGMASGVLTLLAMVPGLPTLPFLTVATALGGFAWVQLRAAGVREAAVQHEPAAGPAVDPLDAAITVDPLSVEVGYALIGLVDERQGGTLLTRVRSIRKQIAGDSGIVVPAVHIADNLQLGPRTYTILLKGVEVARGELYPDRLLAINPGTASGAVDGITTREPAFGLPAWWIAPDLRDRASSAGYTVVDPTTALSTHLSETIRNFLPELLTRQQTKDMVDRVAAAAPKLVEDLVPKVLGLGEIQRVLRQLLRERVPVKDLTSILEAMADAASTSKDPDGLTEAVRSALGRAICRQYQTEQGELPAIGLAPALEQRLMSAVVRTEQGAVLALDPNDAQHLAARIARALESAVAQPVLLCSPALRPHLWRLFSRVLPHLGVLSHNEVPGHVKLTPIAVID
jgi:flagellar biosynthesis protein FlhA